MRSLTIEDWHRRMLQQAHWSKSLRNYLYFKADFGKATRILEVGCGTGAILSEMASNSRSQIMGVDIDMPSLAYAKESLPGSRLFQADGHRLPYPSKYFNITYCHFLLLWVTDPLQVLQEMVRVTQAGGAVIAMAEPDYGGRIDYPENLSLLGTSQHESLRQQGADPNLGRKLAGFFNKSGLINVETGILGGQWHTPPAETEQDMEWMMLESDLGSSVSPVQLEEWREIDRQAWKSGERVLFIPTFYAWGNVPE